MSAGWLAAAAGSDLDGRLRGLPDFVREYLGTPRQRVAMLAPLFAPASIPISVLGIVLGLHSRCLEAVAIGALAIVWAMLALVNSALFWLAFGIIGSAVTAA